MLCGFKGCPGHRFGPCPGARGCWCWSLPLHINPRWTFVAKAALQLRGGRGIGAAAFLRLGKLPLQATGCSAGRGWLRFQYALNCRWKTEGKTYSRPPVLSESHLEACIISMTIVREMLWFLRGSFSESELPLSKTDGKMSRINSGRHRSNAAKAFPGKWAAKSNLSFQVLLLLYIQISKRLLSGGSKAWELPCTRLARPSSVLPRTP